MQVEAQSVVYAVLALISQVGIGFSESSCAIVGNCIGANNVPLAKSFTKMITTMALATFLVICLCVYFSRRQIASLFIETGEQADEDVLDLVSFVL